MNRVAMLITLASGIFVRAQCLEPPSLISLRDYQGPFQKLVGAFARKLELKAVHPPRYKPGTVLCSLETRDKFALFVRDTFDPVSFLIAGFNAALDQASNRDRQFRQGAEGYGKRFAADFAGQTTWRFSRTSPIQRSSRRIRDITG
jgi:hypothetical protein